MTTTHRRTNAINDALSSSGPAMTANKLETTIFRYGTAQRQPEKCASRVSKKVSTLSIFEHVVFVEPKHRAIRLNCTKKSGEDRRGRKKKKKKKKKKEKKRKKKEKKEVCRR
ncbi:hypothetical protein PUN28_004100 [Cardiocondyla obscurior]|uniref:Uncharacterized protein n=1 Tax=Cardiocondyla obscurior TaxID=286306 RepID=A0AAW2GPI8_9HYME